MYDALARKASMYLCFDYIVSPHLPYLLLPTTDTMRIIYDSPSLCNSCICSNPCYYVGLPMSVVFAVILVDCVILVWEYIRGIGPYQSIDGYDERVRRDIHGEEEEFGAQVLIFWRVGLQVPDMIRSIGEFKIEIVELTHG